VAAATANAYRHRAVASTGWPLVRGARKLRPDPLKRLHLSTDKPDPTPAEEAPVARTSLPEADAAQKSAVGLSVRAVAARAAAPIPQVWAPALNTASRSRLGDLPDALDRAVAKTDLGMSRKPFWWTAVGLLQWLFTIAAVVGLGWLIAGYAVRALGLPAFDNPQVGDVPLPTLLLLGGLLLGAMTALLLRPIVNYGARRAGRRAEQRLRGSVTEVAREYVVAPVREVLNGYAQAREALTVVRSE
jgi:hypothetical protein